MGYLAGLVARHGCSPEGRYETEATVAGIAEKTGIENLAAPEGFHWLPARPRWHLLVTVVTEYLCPLAFFVSVNQYAH